MAKSRASDFFSGDKSLADVVSDFIIRPPRATYTLKDLGPRRFRLGDDDPNFPAFLRRDLTLLNMRGMKMQASWYVPDYFKENVKEHKSWQEKEEQRYKEFASSSCTMLSSPPPPFAIPCVVYCHANCGSRYDGQEAIFLLEHGFSVFTFDFCGSGMSDGEYISLGVYEQQDLAAVVEYLTREEEVEGIGLWGRSMGAVTSLLYASRDPFIQCIVCDSPFSSLQQLIEEIAEHRVSKYLPSFVKKYVVDRIRKNVQQRAQFDIHSLNTIKETVSRCRVPALLLHGEKDDFVIPKHSIALRDAYAPTVPCWHQLVEGGHNSNRESSHDLICSFLRIYLLEKPSFRRAAEKALFSSCSRPNSVNEATRPVAHSRPSSSATTSKNTSPAPTSFGPPSTTTTTTRNALPPPRGGRPTTTKGETIAEKTNASAMESLPHTTSSSSFPVDSAASFTVSSPSPIALPDGSFSSFSSIPSPYPPGSSMAAVGGVPSPEGSFSSPPLAPSTLGRTGAPTSPSPMLSLASPTIVKSRPVTAASSMRSSDASREEPRRNVGDIGRTSLGMEHTQPVRPSSPVAASTVPPPSSSSTSFPSLPSSRRPTPQEGEERRCRGAPFQPTTRPRSPPRPGAASSHRQRFTSTEKQPSRSFCSQKELKGGSKSPSPPPKEKRAGPPSRPRGSSTRMRRGSSLPPSSSATTGSPLLPREPPSRRAGPPPVRPSVGTSLVSSEKEGPEGGGLPFLRIASAPVARLTVLQEEAEAAPRHESKIDLPFAHHGAPGRRRGEVDPPSWNTPTTTSTPLTSYTPQEDATPIHIRWSGGRPKEEEEAREQTLEEGLVQVTRPSSLAPAVADTSSFSSFSPIVTQKPTPAVTPLEPVNTTAMWRTPIVVRTPPPRSPPLSPPLSGRSSATPEPHGIHLHRPLSSTPTSSTTMERHSTPPGLATHVGSHSPVYPAPVWPTETTTSTSSSTASDAMPFHLTSPPIVVRRPPIRPTSAPASPDGGRPARAMAEGQRPPRTRATYTPPFHPTSPYTTTSYPSRATWSTGDPAGNGSLSTTVAYRGPAMGKVLPSLPLFSSPPSQERRRGSKGEWEAEEERGGVSSLFSPPPLSFASMEGVPQGCEVPDAMGVEAAISELKASNRPIMFSRPKYLPP